MPTNLRGSKTESPPLVAVATLKSVGGRRGTPVRWARVSGATSGSIRRSSNVTCLSNKDWNVQIIWNEQQ